MILPDRALIVRQPWVDLILSGKKTWEMRSRPTSVRGRVGLIEAGTGLVVGQVNIIDSLDDLPLSELSENTHFEKHRVPHDKINLLLVWPFPWVLSNAILYETPIKYNHPKGAVIWVDLTKDGVIPENKK